MPEDINILKDYVTTLLMGKNTFVKIYFKFLKKIKMADTKKPQHSDNKSAKSSKDEMSKVSSSKQMSNNSDSSDKAKSDKKTASSHSK